MIFRNLRLRKWKKRLAIVSAKLDAQRNASLGVGVLKPSPNPYLMGAKVEAEFMVKLLEQKDG